MYRHVTPSASNTSNRFLVVPPNMLPPVSSFIPNYLSLRGSMLTNEADQRRSRTNTSTRPKVHVANPQNSEKTRVTLSQIKNEYPDN